METDGGVLRVFAPRARPSVGGCRESVSGIPAKTGFCLRSHVNKTTPCYAPHAAQSLPLLTHLLRRLSPPCLHALIIRAHCARCSASGFPAPSSCSCVLPFTPLTSCEQANVVARLGRKRRCALWRQRPSPAWAETRTPWLRSRAKARD